MKQLPGINYLKGFSIASIVVYHIFQQMELAAPWNTLIRFGGTGVHLFVLISGFGLFSSELRRPQKFPDFLKKRGLNIYLPYIVIVVLSALVGLATGIFKVTWTKFFSHLLLFKMFNEGLIGSLGYPLWFMSMIFQFYIAFHLLVWIYRKLKDHQFFLLCLSVSLAYGISLIALGKETQRIWNSFFLQYLWEFSLGMILAKAYHQKRFSRIAIPTKPLVLVWGLSTVLFLGLSYSASAWVLIFNDYLALVSFSSTALLMRAFLGESYRGAMMWVSRFSFEVYLLHTLMILISLQLFENQLIGLGFGLFTTLLLSPIYQRIHSTIANFILSLSNNENAVTTSNKSYASS